MNRSSTLKTTVFAITAASGLVLMSACSNATDDATGAATSSSSVAPTSATAATSSPAATSAQSGGDTAMIDSASGPISVDPAVLAKYTELGGSTGYLGAATGPAIDVAGGTEVNFGNGSIFYSAETGAHLVQGEILRVYTTSLGPAGTLKFPITDETEITGGWESEFQGGTITWTDKGAGRYAETVTTK